MVIDLLLASGILLSTASQLRLTALPIGPGELLLLAWILLAMGREAARLGPPITIPFTILVVFWAAFAVAQSLGTMTGYVLGDIHDRGLLLHNVMAYSLLAVVSCLVVVGPGAGRRLHRITWLIVSLGAAFLLAQLAHGFDLIGIPGVEPWYWGLRFRGWSTNANQLALLCAVLTLLALHLAEVAKGAGARIGALGCGLVAIVAGRLSLSDSFVLVLACCLPVFVALKLRTWAASPAPGLRPALAWVAIIALPVAAMATVPLVNMIVVEAKDVAREMARGEDADTERSASVRFTIWNAAIQRGLESGLIGLGPAPHVENPFPVSLGPRSAESLKYSDQPEPGLIPNFEAHNTILDLFTQSGLLGVLSVVGLGGLLVAGTWAAKLDGLLTLLCGLAIFSLFHFIMRHPIFWFAVALCLVASDAARATPRLSHASDSG
jgi:hypothetical protein